MLLLSGCVAPAPLYRPDAHVMAFMDEGGVAQVGANISALSGYSGEIIVSPISHALVFGRGMTSHSSRYRQRYWELGVGGYVAVGSRVRVELLGAMGRGSPYGEGSREILTDDGRPTTEGFNYRADHERIYGQINVVAIADNDGLLVGGALRLNRVQYQGFRSSPGGLFDQVEGTFFEPALLLRAPLMGALSLEGEIGVSLALDRKNWELFETRRQYGSIGIRYQIGR